MLKQYGRRAMLLAATTGAAALAACSDNPLDSDPGHEHADDPAGLHEGEAVMLAGDSFPACDTCFERVRFRLVRTAPYIFDDADFES